MHVCLTGAKTCPPRIGGVEVFVFELGRKLASRGVRVSLISRMEPGQKKLEVVEGVEVHRIRGSRKRSLLKLSMMPGILRIANVLKPEILHANDATSGFVTTIGSNRSKTVVTIHGIGFSKEDWPFPFRQGIRLFQLQSLKRACAVTATDDHTAAQLRSVRQDINVVPGGVDATLFRKGALPRPAEMGDDRTNIIFVGRLTRVKGVDLLLEALPLLERSLQSRIRLLIIGRGEMFDWQPREGGPYEIKWLGERPHSDVAPYLANADLFVLPSRSEGLPLSLLEAMSSEVPVVCTRVGGVGATIDEKYATIVDSLSPGGVAQGIASALGDDAGRRSKAAAGRRLIQESFTWDRIAEKYLRIYRSLIC